MLTAPFSAPVSVAVGAGSIATEANRGTLQCHAHQQPDRGEPPRTSASCADALRPYARFPQGLPAGVDEDALVGRAKPKPAPVPTPTLEPSEPSPPTPPTPATPRPPAPYDAPKP